MTQDKDWSLAGKDFNQTYTYEQIETLRQLLVADIERFFKEDIIPDLQKQIVLVAPDPIIKLINKRFGVEDDMSKM